MNVLNMNEIDVFQYHIFRLQQMASILDVCGPKQMTLTDDLEFDSGFLSYCAYSPHVGL